MRELLSHASIIGFSATPGEKIDASTRAVFGDVISVCAIKRAEQDCAKGPT